MTTVKILDSYVGVWTPGQLVHNAPPELVSLAERKVRNVATGGLVAQIVEGTDVVGGSSELQVELDASRKEEQRLRSELDESQKREQELRSQLNEISKPPADQTGDEFDLLKAQAKELKIAGYTKMSADELREAIEAGGEGNAE